MTAPLLAGTFACMIYYKSFLTFALFYLAFTSLQLNAQDYQPRFWIEDDQLTLDQAHDKGWGGILYWGTEREGDQMKYFFKSPFLEKQKWAVAGKDGLSDLVKKAHQKGVKVMMNIEAVNPYHWSKNQWTPENIRSVASDMAATGVDAIFEECFEAKPDVFLALAKSLKEKNVNYISGTDPMLLRESSFVRLWPETGTINIYNYYLKRDQLYNVATLTQHGSLGLGWAKYWNKPTAMISPLTRDWGIDVASAPAVVSYLCMIRALQFRLDNFIIFGGADLFDPIQTKNWINTYVSKQEKDRPVVNIVVLLDQKDASNTSWDRLFNSGDAITSGAFNAGYQVVVSDKIIPADAYWIYAPGGEKELPADVVKIMASNKPVFIQAASYIPSGKNIGENWRQVLGNCGVDAGYNFKYASGTDGQNDISLPESQEEEIPYTGYYKGHYLRFTGTDVQRGKELRAGTIIPPQAISGKILSQPNETYGKGPYLIGKNNKYLVTTTALGWETAYPIADLLSGGGVLPGSNVWGIAGKQVSAFLAIETTALEVKIPGLADGTEIHVVIWDREKRKKKEETIRYQSPYKQVLNAYDFILIDVVNYPIN